MAYNREAFLKNLINLIVEGNPVVVMPLEWKEVNWEDVVITALRVRECEIYIDMGDPIRGGEMLVILEED